MSTATNTKRQAITGQRFVAPSNSLPVLGMWHYEPQPVGGIQT